MNVLSVSYCHWPNGKCFPVSSLYYKYRPIIGLNFLSVLQRLLYLYLKLPLYFDFVHFYYIVYICGDMYRDMSTSMYQFVKRITYSSLIENWYLSTILKNYQLLSLLILPLSNFFFNFYYIYIIPFHSVFDISKTLFQFSFRNGNYSTWWRS